MEARGGAPGGGAGRGGIAGQGLPLNKPPYDRITAYDMNSGEVIAGEGGSGGPVEP